jgi:PhnB protein
MAGVNPIPDDYPRIVPYLCVDGAAHAIEFYATVFGALERMRVPSADGRIGHAELQLGDGVIMLADEYPEIDFRSPRSVGGTPVTIHVYVTDVDDVFDRALQNGATERREVADQDYGERSGQFEDPWGHRWHVSSRIEQLSAEEMARRAAESPD